MILTLRVGLTALVVWSGYVAVVACRGEAEGRGALAELTEEQLSEYHRAIDELGQRTGFDLLRPAYLPLGTEWEPDTNYGIDENEAVMTFYRGRLHTAVWERPVIRIAQVKDPDGQICPPCAGDESDPNAWNANGRIFLADLGQPGPGRVFAAVYFRVQDIRVEAYFDWESPAHTSEMKQEALKVVQSMLEQS